MRESFVGFGHPQEWVFFQESYPNFAEAHRKLQATFAQFFSRIINKEQPDADRVVFDLGFICCEQFNELCLLCANGYGIAGQRVLRGIYESGVAADYISAFPDEAVDFLDWGDVHLYKDFKESSMEREPEFAENWRYVESNYLKVKNKFQMTDCKKCGTTKPMHSWNKKDVRSQAKAAKSFLEPYYNQAYFHPTLQIHSTVPSILARMDVDPDTDQLYISNALQRERAMMTLRTAHMIILIVLFTQEKHFGLGMEPELVKRGKELEICWSISA